MIAKRIKYLVALWLLLAAAIVAAIVVLERRSLDMLLATEIDGLQRIASQRADQHDAHLTNLSAIAVADAASRRDLFLNVAATIQRFYPRITAIDLVPLTTDGDIITTRPTLTADIRLAITNAVHNTDGALVILPAINIEGRYLLIKRSPNSDDARFGLALEIDSEALLEAQGAFWHKDSVQRALLAPDGPFLLNQKPAGGIRMQRVLSSKSQPLLIQASFAPELAEMLPVGRIVSSVVLMTILLLAASKLALYAGRTKRAEQSARLSAQETRLIHAARVNALGEMASGMSHELTQPLTAILSQSQAGLRLLDSPEGAMRVKTVLNDTVDQARRASAILERLRNWSRPTSGQAKVTSLREAIKGVQNLTANELQEKAIVMDMERNPADLAVLADPVELEQVIFNLIRNAIKALEDMDKGGKKIIVSSHREGDHAVIEVADTGPGVASELRATLFDPFVSGQSDGTGLGLALSTRLVERMSGEIILMPSGGHGAHFSIRLPLADVSKISEAAQ